MTILEIRSHSVILLFFAALLSTQCELGVLCPLHYGLVIPFTSKVTILGGMMYLIVSLHLELLVTFNFSFCLNFLWFD